MWKEEFGHEFQILNSKFLISPSISIRVLCDLCG